MIVLLTGGCDGLFGDSESDSKLVIGEQCPDPVNMFYQATTGLCACNQPGFTLIDNRCCDPSCDGVECGTGDCGQHCGDCPQNGTCVQNQCCEPSCDGHTCGNDGCGGQCGTCSESEFCTEDGQCCGPNCDGTVCGDDGCGGSCGNCPQNGACVNSGQECECTASCANGLIINPDCSTTSCAGPDEQCDWEMDLEVYSCLPKCKPDDYGEVHFTYIEGDLDGDGEKDDSYDDYDHSVVMDVGNVIGDGIIKGKYATSGDVNACAAGEVDRYRLNFECAGTPKIWISNTQGGGSVSVTTDAWTMTDVGYPDGHLPLFHGQMDIEVECSCTFNCSFYDLSIEFL